MSDVRWRFDLCESRFVTCAWRKCSTTYISALVIAFGGLWCLVTLDLHGEGGARDLQWWCFFVAHAMLRQQRVLYRGVVTVPWLGQGGVDDGFSLSIRELLVTMMWKLLTTSLMCKAMRVDDEARLSSLMSLCRSPVTRVVQADVLDH